MKKTRKGDVVMVKWQDIVTELSSDKPTDTIEAVSVGRVESCRGKTVRLTSGWYTDEENWPEKDTIAIPKGCIDSVEVLK